MTEQDDLWAGMGSALEQGQGFVLATVVATSSSAPRPVGTQMAILDDGTVVGSVSGGCVEGDVYARAEDVAESGQPQLQDYGYSDDTAFSVGLTCGGSISVYLEQVLSADLDFYRGLAARVVSGEPVACITAIAGTDLGWHTTVESGGDGRGDLSGECRTVGEVEQQAAAMLRDHRSGVLTIRGEDGDADTSYFVRSYGAPARMVVFGSNAFAAALVRVAKVVGYHVTVCDARVTFASRERFPGADELVVQWPQEYLATLDVDHRTVLCVLTHDPKFDDPLLEVALGSPAGFIGAMGSRRTTEERYERLRAKGLGSADLHRLHAPFGLDLGARTPEETAVSMIAEIISSRDGGSNRPLRESRGPIHRLNQQLSASNG